MNKHCLALTLLLSSISMQASESNPAATTKATDSTNMLGEEPIKEGGGFGDTYGPGIDWPREGLSQQMLGRWNLSHPTGAKNAAAKNAKRASAAAACSAQRSTSPAPEGCCPLPEASSKES